MSTNGPNQPKLSRQAAARERKAFRQRAKVAAHVLVGKSKQRAVDGESDGVALLPYVPLSAPRVSGCPVSFNKDATLCFVPDTVSIRVYRCKTAQLLSTLTPEEVAPDASVTSLMLNPLNALQLLVASADGYVRTWDYLEGREIRSLFLGLEVAHMCSHADQPETLYLVARQQDGGSRPASDRRPSDRIFRATWKVGGVDLIEHCTLIGKVSRVTGMDITHDGAFLVVASGGTGGLHIAKTSAVEAGFAILENGHRFTSLAVHPSERTIATGDEKGRIQLWYPFDAAFWSAFTASEADQRRRTIGHAPSQTFHWHAHAVAAVVFTSNGAYLLSGGEEGVLVLWEIASGHRQYLPRLGAPIRHLRLAPTGHDYALSLLDASVLFVDAATFAPRQSIASVKLDSTGIRRRFSEPLPLAIEPETQTLVVASSHPSSIQFFSYLTGSHVLELEISPTNRSSKTDDVPIEPARVEQIAFSPKLPPDGILWMATVDTWHSEAFSPELYLKLWQRSPPSAGGTIATWTLDTRIDRPHGLTGVSKVVFAPVGGAGSLMLATSGHDKHVRIWSCPRGPGSWHCRSALSYRDQTPTDIAWSADASILAIAFRSIVTLWKIDTEVADFATSFSVPLIAPVSCIAFAGKEGTLLVAGGQGGCVVWDIVSGEEQMHFACRPSAILPQNQSDSIVILEAINASGRHAQACTNIFQADLVDQSVDVRRLQAVVKSAILLASTAKTYTLAFLSFDGSLALAGHDVLSQQSAPAMRIELADSLSTPTVFDELFGRSTRDDAVPSLARPSVMERPSTISDILQAPTHVLPPLHSFWRELLPLPPRRRDSAENVSVESEPSEPVVMQVDKDENPRRPAVLPVYDFDLGHLLKEQLRV